MQWQSPVMFSAPLSATFTSQWHCLEQLLKFPLSSPPQPKPNSCRTAAQLSLALKWVIHPAIHSGTKRKRGFFLSPALTCDLSKLASSPGLLRSTYGWICTSFNLRSQEDAVSHLSHSSFREAHPTCSQQVPTFPLSLKGRRGRQEWKVLKVRGMRLHKSRNKRNEKAGDMQTRGASKERMKAGEAAREERDRKSAERQPRESITGSRAHLLWQWDCTELPKACE